MTQPPSGRLATDELLAHAGFIRGLARALVSGDADVDDVVQDTWLAALGANPSEVRRPRSWLASIVRRRAARHHRTRIRADRNLPMAAPRSEAPEPPTLAMRHEVIQRVSVALAALPDHERDAVVLRYYEDLPPRVVARRLDVPVETARTRIRRGLEHLRESLDERHEGQRAAWAAPLSILIPKASAAVGAIAVLTKLATLAAVLLLGAYVVGRATGGGRSTVDHGSGPLTAEGAPPVLGGHLAPDPEPSRSEPDVGVPGPTTAPGNDEAASSPTMAAAREYEVRVRITDPTGQPVSDLGICEFTRGAGGPLDITSRFLGRTDPAGRAVVVVSGSPAATGLGLELGPAAPWHVEEGPSGMPSPGEEAVFIVVPRTLVRGRVLDERGEPLPGVRVLAQVQVRSEVGTSSTEFIRLDPTDEEGRFTATFPRYAQEAILSVRTADAKASARIDPSQQTDIVLRLEVQALIRGEVVQEDGLPLVRPDHLMPRVEAIPVEGGESINGTFTSGTHRFAIPVRAGGRYRVAVTWPSNLASALATPDAVVADAPAEGLRIACPSGQRLSGRMEGDATSGFTLDWLERRPPARGPDVRRSLRVAADGRFAFGGLQEGDTFLYVSRPGDDRYALLENVRLPDDDLAIHLREGLTIDGRVPGYVGRQGFDLYLEFLWRGPSIHAQVQEDGTFRLTGLPPGEYGLRWKRAGRSGDLERQVQAGESGVEIVLPLDVLHTGLLRGGAR